MTNETGGRTTLNHCLQVLINRKQIRIAKVIVHEDYTKNTNDIALLKLGKDDPHATYYLLQHLYQRTG